MSTQIYINREVIEQQLERISKLDAVSACGLGSEAFSSSSVTKGNAADAEIIYRKRLYAAAREYNELFLQTRLMVERIIDSFVDVDEFSAQAIGAQNGSSGGTGGSSSSGGTGNTTTNSSQQPTYTAESFTNHHPSISDYVQFA